MTIKPSTPRRVVAAIAAGVVVVALSAPAAAERGPIADVAAIKAQLDLMTSADRVPGALAQVRDRRGKSVTITSGTAELRVRLDAPVETYLPGVVRGTGEGSAIDGHDIPVRQLLQHISGLPDYLPFVTESTQPVEAAELVRVALAHKPDSVQGQGWRYSNTGYILAGMIVERVTHKDIGAAVTDLVIRPAHLRNTYWPPAGERRIRGPHAHNYAMNKDVTEFEPSWAGAGGAIVSTPSDLNRFWQKLDRLLPPRVLAQMHTTKLAPDLGHGVTYGLGIARVTLSCGDRAWAHMGGLANGGVANISGRDDSGRSATVYLTAQTSGRLLQTFDVAFCGSRGLA